MAESLSPMVKQYQEIKSKHQDAILFFRLGDFYEMFNDDAKLASKELELTLTGRGEGDNRMPMCGIPYHASLNYISKLLNKGYKVAICEQVEDPKTAKSVVKREVIKVITPGTVLEEKMLNERSGNYLLAISFLKDHIGLAYIDATTGEFKATRIKGISSLEALIDEIKRIDPAEILVPDIVPTNANDLISTLSSLGYSFTSYKDVYDLDIAQKALKEHFKISSIESFGLRGFEPAFGATVAILDYLKNTQKGTLDHINKLQPYETGKFVYIDSATRRNLELINTVREKSLKGSLLWVIDRTATPMGSRLLKRWILQPLTDIEEINKRLDAVEELHKDQILREELSKLLSYVFDIERITGRIASGVCNARDLIALKESLSYLPQIKHALKASKAAKLKEIKELNEMNELRDFIGKAIIDEPPLALKEGGLIKMGFDHDLDNIKDISRGGKEWISQLEIKERQRTGIKSLKVGYTSVFGYYIEVSKSNAGLVPADYIRKQTLVNCERYVTPELKEKETAILNAEDKLFKMEYEVFTSVRKNVATFTVRLQYIAQLLAELDVLISFAKIAAEYNYCRPVIEDSNEILIKAGRHPVVERTIGENLFTSNDTKMDMNEARFILITGPNMAGKSTYMRQIALILIMAHVGSFVPASSADLPLIDRIFTRIGAMDDIYAGQSTFMVEMTETANIINNATSKSLIILDEIGRGTSTFDGMSIAAAVSEYIHEKINAYTLFATHYHEITQLADKHKGMLNFNTLVKKEGDKVIFLHKIVPGPADQSYGIEVARLAGLPGEITDRAKEIYNTLQMVEANVAKEKKAKKGYSSDQIDLF